MSDVIFYEGIEYKSKNELCLAYNLCLENILYRVKSKGISFIDSFNYYRYKKDDIALELKSDIVTIDIIHKKAIELNIHVDDIINYYRFNSNYIEYNNVFYKSRHSLCSHYNISTAFVYNKAKEFNIDFLEAIKLAVNDKSSSEIIYNNIIYSSMAVACRDLGLDYPSIYAYIKRHNCTFDEAVSVYKNDLNGKFVFEDNIFNSKKEACAFYGLNSATVYHKSKSLFNGDFIKGLKYCIDNNISKTHHESITFRGIRYATRAELCKEYNLDYSHLLSECKNKNISFDVAVELGIKRSIERRNKGFTFRGEYFSNKSELCKKYNLIYSTVSKFAEKRNITFLEAVNYYLDNGVNDGFKKKVMYNGVLYSSRKEICDKFGINHSAIRNRAKRNNLDFIDALELCILSKNFSIVKINDILFNCTCKNCGKNFVFNKNLALQHINECNKSS